MISIIYSSTTVGLNGVLVKVEVDTYSRGFPTFAIVGLPDKAIDESKERVRTAIKNSEYSMPDCKLVVNLAPADIPKEGSLFDLPIAVGIIMSTQGAYGDVLKNSIFVGELSLEGKVRPVPGVLSIAFCARENNISNIFVPHENAREAAMVSGVNVYPVDNLRQVIFHIQKIEEIQLFPYVEIDNKNIILNGCDFSDIKGQHHAKRAAEISASGMHNIHLKGPPGSGKTLLARAIPSIMPYMDKEEVVEVSKIYSIMRLNKDQLIISRPFRAPHHTISRIGLIGGGTKLSPGEISLSHRGILFLDEFAEFPRSVLEALRQPMEDGEVTISRAVGSADFPCRFLLVAASNPCPCGYLGHLKKPCRCSFHQIEKYKKRLSGPILDRIDLHVDMPALKEEDYDSVSVEESSDVVRTRVLAAREIQNRRFENSCIKSNSEMSSSDIKKYCVIEGDGINILKQAIDKLSLSARSYFKIIKVSQTIADLAGHKTISATDISEALQYRSTE